MPYRVFTKFNIFGAFLWAVGITTAGYVLGETVPSIDRYLLPIIFVIILLSLLPPLLEYRRHRKQAQPATEAEAFAEQRELEELLDED